MITKMLDASKCLCKFQNVGQFRTRACLPQYTNPNNLR